MGSESLTRSWGRLVGSVALVVATLLSGRGVMADVVTLVNLPQIQQHNPVFDRDASDGNQNGEFWCAPTAMVSALLWLAERYDRPDIVPRDASGQRYTTEAFVRYLGERWFDTRDQTGTGEQRWHSALWGYLQGTPYAWRMNVYVAPKRLTEITGPSYFAHATVDDLYEEMRSAEDDPGAVVLMAYQHTNALGKVEKHATLLQQLADQKDVAQRYPGKIMDPYFGRFDDIEFEGTNGIATSANLWDAIAWRDVYLAIAIAPVAEPGALPLAVLALVLATVARRRRARRDPAA